MYSKTHPLGGLPIGGHANPVGRCSESHAITVIPFPTTFAPIPPPALPPPRDEKPDIHSISRLTNVGFLTPANATGFYVFHAYARPADSTIRPPFETPTYNNSLGSRLRGNDEFLFATAKTHPLGGLPCIATAFSLRPFSQKLNSYATFGAYCV